MQAVIKAVEADQWIFPEAENYKKLKEELSASNGLVLRRNKIIILSSLRGKPVDLAHGGHQGIEKATNQRQSVVLKSPQAIRREGQKLSFMSSCFSQITTTRTPSMIPNPSAPWK